MQFEIEAYMPKVEDLITEFGIDINGKVQKTIDTTFIHYMRLNMPLDSAEMIINTRNPEGGIVSVETPYAHYQNEGILYVNPEHNAPGFPIYKNGVLVDYVGYKGKRVPSDRKLKNYMDNNGGPGRGSHFVERTITNYENEIVGAGQEMLNRI